MNVQALKQVPPWAWIAVTAAVGLAALTWLRYAQDDEDTDWTTPKETQPPRQVRSEVPSGDRRSGRLSGAFRMRAYPSTLADASFSIIGEV